ncbi:MAG: hypothetical protein AAFY36_19215, partial [Bacteroidota bacterium]
MMRLLSLLLLLATLVPETKAQFVWPGDVNNNGIVNQVDLLYVGIAFGATGPGRPDENTDWEAMPVPGLWSESFPDGLNYHYADTDGNGVVNSDDVDDAIEGNYGLTHGIVSGDGYQNASAGEGAPSFRFEANMLVVEPGEILTIDLFLDDIPEDPSDVYGMALDMSYSVGFIEGDDGPDFDLTEDSWLNTGNDSFLELFEEGDGNGQADLGLSRTDLQTVTPGAEPIGQISIVIEDIIVGLIIDTFELSID